MNGSEVALDTTVAIAVLNNEGNAGTWIKTFTAVYLPIPVLAELRFGALKSAKTTANLAKVQKLAGGCTILDANDAIATKYAETRLQLQKNGTPIPENDLWIAAICLENDIQLTTEDRHFKHVKGLALSGSPTK